MAISKERTPEELKNQDLNYFIAFDIEPTETNVKKIEEALNNKRKTFSRVVTPITTRLIELKDDIDKVMLNDVAARKKEADAARAFYAKRAIEMAETLCKSGYIEDTKIDEIAKRFYVTSKEILDGISGLLSQGVVLKKVAGVKREVSFSNFKKIEAYLRTLGKRDLYDFSELPETSQTKDLYNKQEEIYSVFSKKANDAKGKAAMDLSGIGKVVFKSDAARREYDIYAKTKVKVWDSLSTLSDSGIKVVNDKFFIDCLDALRGDAGLSVDDAEKELYAYMSNFKLTRESSEKLHIELCPYDDCQKPYVLKNDTHSCPNCGRSLEMKCWNCGNVTLLVSKTQACKKCGITKKAQTEFDAAQKALATLLDSPSSAGSAITAAMNKLENVYPTYDKFPTSLVGKNIIALKQQIEQRVIATCPYDDCKKPYIFKAGIKSCPNCGKSLEIKCWNCGEITLFKSNTQACSKCGISKSNQNEFNIAQKAFDNLLKSQSCTELELVGALNKLENVYPKYSQFPTSFVSKAITAAKQQTERRKNEIVKRNALYEKYVKELNAMIAKKQFYHAETLLKQLKNEDPTYDTKELDAKIGTALKNAQIYVDSANRYLKANNEDAAVESGGKALQICSDCAAALQVLKNFPPKPPHHLIAKIFRNTVKLDWQTEGNQDAITYTVIRKVGSAPANDQDGDVLEKDLTINFYEDPSVVSATAYYYAVFSVRGDVCSQIAVTSTPTVMYLDVSNLHQEKTAASIKATWAVPDNVKGVEVYRKAGAVPPIGKDDGEKIACDINGFDDANVKEDKYSYLILCKYSYSGKTQYSTGIKASYTKFRLPSKLQNVQLDSAGTTDFTLSCEKPENGSIKLYVSDKHLDLPFGDVDDKANFVKKYKALKELDTIVLSENKLSFSIPPQKVMWVYPVVSNEQLFVLSDPIMLNTISGIENVNVINKGGNITIEGTLNSSVRNVIAIISNEGFVSNVDDSGDRRTCSYDSFIRDKGFYISLKPGVYYITLFAEFKEGGNTFYSKAVKLPEVIDNSEKTVVEYALTYTPNVSAPYKVKLDFICSDPLTLPDVDIVGGYPKPMNKNSGKVLTTVTGGAMKKKLFKKGFRFSVQVTVDSASNKREKLTLFLHSDTEKRVQLKEVQKI